MFAIMEITLKKLREPAFFLMLFLTVLLGYFVSDMESIAAQLSQDSILSHLVIGNSRNQPVLSSTFLAFVISMLLACFSGAAEIPRDISSGQIMLLLTKPISRTEYMLGKYFGVLLICLLYFCATECSVMVSHFYSSGSWYAMPLMVRQFQMALAFIPFVAIIISFSCFMGDIASIVFTVLYLLFSMLFNMIPILIAMLPEGFAGGVENYIYMLYYFFPNLIFYFIDYKFAGIVSFALTAYSVAIAVIFLLIASYRLNHMDFSRYD